MFWTGLWGVLGAFLVPPLSMPRWLGWVLFAAMEAVELGMAR